MGTISHFPLHFLQLSRISLNFRMKSTTYKKGVYMKRKKNKKTSDTRIIGMTGFVWAREGWCPAEGVGWRQDCYIPFEAVSQVENWEKSFRWYFLLFGFVRPPRMLFPLRHLYPYPPPPPHWIKVHLFWILWFFACTHKYNFLFQISLLYSNNWI